MLKLRNSLFPSSTQSCDQYQFYSFSDNYTGKYTWSYNQKTIYQNWFHNPPVDTEGRQDCVFIYTSKYDNNIVDNCLYCSLQNGII